MPKLMKFVTALSLMLMLLVQPIYAAEKSVKIKVTVVSVKLVENNHVGNEWLTVAKINGKEVSAGSSVTLTLKASETIHLDAYAEEQDKIPEDGESTASVKASSIGKTTNKALSVVVTENRGRYSGETATWKFTFKLQKLT
ncbi:hypothetical protein OMP38_26550 [Cohnella ginsengisoli]|uniref:YtkA-like domain-containing protein n=1 Tax=Cohnella ginsengisoli TaxID=425004 RepID=A0A9X4QQQ6_9BACL|nr:hypothetical protein [Cohnella ginsengisoli]MDG0793985.1 hypothetical protein [Cohnella ginsengisoli]